MRNARLVKLVGVVILLMFNAPARADDCDRCRDILWHGIYDEFNYKSAEEFQKDFRFVLKMSKEERQKYVKENEGSLTVGLKKIFSLGLAGSDTEEEFRELKENLSIDERLIWNSKSFQKIQIKMVNAKIVDAWKECIAKCAGGIQLKVIGDGKGTFIIQVSWTPTNAELANKSVKVKHVTVDGAKEKGAPKLKDGSVIPAFSGLSGLYTRDGKGEVKIVIDFDGHPSINKTLPEIPEPTPVPPKPLPTIITHVRIEYWVGDDDKSPNEVVTHEVLADGKVVLSKDTPSKAGLKPPFGMGERWDWRGIKGPYPAKRKAQIPGLAGAAGKMEGEKKFDFGNSDEKTFPLNDKAPIEFGKGTKGKLSITKSGTERWEGFSVRLYGVTNKGYEIRYDKDWKTTLQGAKNDAGWEFEWDKGQ